MYITSPRDLLKTFTIIIKTLLLLSSVNLSFVQEKKFTQIFPC